MRQNATASNKKDKKKPPRKFTDEEIAEAYVKGACTMLGCAMGLGIHRSSLYRLLEERPELKAILEQAEEELGDICEMKLYQLIKKQDGPSIRFALSTKFKKRGYARFDDGSQQIINDNRTIIVNFDNPDDEERYRKALEADRVRQVRLLAEATGDQAEDVPEG